MELFVYVHQFLFLSCLYTFSTLKYVIFPEQHIKELI